jgi:hypothetical protein
MLKSPYAMNALEIDAAAALDGLLAQIPPVEQRSIEVAPAPAGPDRGIDFIAHITVQGRRYQLICEVKSSGQPRHVRSALLELRNYAAHHPSAPYSFHDDQTVPVFIAPYLSAEARQLCLEYEINYLDLTGNTRLAFDGIFIERALGKKPAAETRKLKSPFRPKSAQILRLMLRMPQRAWRVAELADAAQVSVGHVSNIRTMLLDREWAKTNADGFYISAPDALLDAWRDAYVPPAGQRQTFYTVLHGRALEDAARNVLKSSDTARPQAAFAAFSAARWLAPYARTGTDYFYATRAGLNQLRSALQLSSASKGENVVITVLKDASLLADTTEPAPGIICTSPLQTYLDLTTLGERGQEAADHLRQDLLTWQK